MSDFYQKLEFTTKDKPQFKCEVQPCFSLKDKDKALLILVAIAVAEGLDIEYGFDNTVFLTFEIVSRVQPADPMLKTIVAPSVDSRIHFGDTKGDPEALKTLVGRRFSAKLIQTWKYQSFGSQVVGENAFGEEAFDEMYETTKDWIIDIDTLELLEERAKN